MLLIFSILCALGLLFVFVEFLVPGGILGTVGAVLLLTSVIGAYLSEGIAMGNVFLICTMVALAVLIPVGMRIFPKTTIGKKMTLGESMAAGNSSPETLPAIGSRGIALTPLRPVGTGRFGEQRIDARSESVMLETGTAILVIGHENGAVVVRKAED